MEDFLFLTWFTCFFLFRSCSILFFHRFRPWSLTRVLQPFLPLLVQPSLPRSLTRPWGLWLLLDSYGKFRLLNTKQKFKRKSKMLLMPRRREEKGLSLGRKHRRVVDSSDGGVRVAAAWVSSNPSFFPINLSLPSEVKSYELRMKQSSLTAHGLQDEVSSGTAR